MKVEVRYSTFIPNGVFLLPAICTTIRSLFSSAFRLQSDFRLYSAALPSAAHIIMTVFQLFAYIVLNNQIDASYRDVYLILVYFF